MRPEGGARAEAAEIAVSATLLRVGAETEAAGGGLHRRRPDVASAFRIAPRRTGPRSAGGAPPADRSRRG